MKSFGLLMAKTLCFGLIFVSVSSHAAVKSQPIFVEMATSLGRIVLQLDSNKAPKTCANFLSYIDDQFYSGTIFHRVISEFMIQGGGYTRDLKEKSVKPPVVNESNNGLSNLRGTIAMARTPDPNSATSQFFINVVDNSFLDFESPNNYGYTVFGKVILGMDVMDSIRDVPTYTSGKFEDLPRKTVVIWWIRKI